METENQRAGWSLSWMMKIGYGCGDLGYGVVFQCATVFLIFYATVILGLSGKLVGVIAGIGVIWDGVTDPIMGYISDRTKSRLGRRHVYLLAGSISIAVCNLLLWNIPAQWPTYGKVILLIAALILLKSAMTIYATPYTALGTELTADYGERTALQSIRALFFVLGLCLPTILGMMVFFRPTEAFANGQMNPLAYRNLSITTSSLALALGMTAFLTTKKRIPHLAATPVHREGGLLRNMAMAAKNREFRAIAGGYLLSNIASAVVGAIGMHVFTFAFALSNRQIAVVFGVLFGMALLSQLLWNDLTGRIGKRNALLTGMGAAIAGGFYLIGLYGATQGACSVLALVPFSLLVGIGIGAMSCLPASMLADAMDLEGLHTGDRKEGIFVGSMTLAYKLSQSVALMGVGALLDAVGFDAALPAQSPQTQAYLTVSMSLICIVAIGLAILAYSRSRLTREKVEDIQRQLTEQASPKEENDDTDPILPRCQGA